MKAKGRSVLIRAMLVVFSILFFTTSTMAAQNMQQENKEKTIRLLMPQWQGGDYDLSVRTGNLYPIGSQILAMLAPKSDAPLIQVPIEAYSESMGRPKQNGVYWQDVVLRQMRAARDILEKHTPARVITFGGDCLISQGPLDYLNGHYKGKLGVLWIDAHPDISTPANHDREHAMVLGNLLGGGDPIFARDVKNPVKTDQVMIIGVEKYNSDAEKEIVKAYGMPVLQAKDVDNSSEKVIDWIKNHNFDNIAIHLDLDVLDPSAFYSQFPNDPGGVHRETAVGKLTFPQVTRLINDIASKANIVGFGIAEHMPWDAYNLKHMLEQFKFMK